jgi:hypothetical protein
LTFKSAPEIFVLNSPEFAYGFTGHNFSQYFYYNPVKTLGENALLRPKDMLPAVLVYNPKNTAEIMPAVSDVIYKYYRTYEVAGTSWIMTLNTYVNR